MKNVLIVGKKSYIGVYFAEYAKNDFNIDTVDSFGGAWKSADFSKYDVVYHVAGIAHVDAKKDQEELYFKINRDLAIEVAQYAKEKSVKQFIFMSSIIVYGESKTLEKQVITADTLPSPNGFYGESKLQAEQGILPLADDSFKVVVVRPPMIYGNGCKGNYPRLAKLAKKLPFFPYFDNERSMLYIDNLCEFLKLAILNDANGIFFPQNKEYTNVPKLVKTIAFANGKKLRLIKGFGLIIKLASKFPGAVNKVFGSLVYDKGMSNHFDWAYAVKTLEDSVKETEGNK